jgi:alpha-L-arabinofuranosidase
MKTILSLFITVLLIACAPSGHEYHVSVNGSDTGDGTAKAPFKTISAAAAIAQPGDVITVHAGIYRERVNPPRGGLSESERITYKAAPGEQVLIKGSEVVKGWELVQDDTWKAVVPNSLFGDFNPFSDLINGDWFSPLGRPHHTGAVYLKGHWLTEAAVADSVLKPAGDTPYWFAVADSLKEGSTTIWAQFRGVDPNSEEVEVNVRQAVFYPENPGINYLTVKGFTMEHAATPWAPPTAEQIGLIGTHWSKGWIIEDNIIRYSTCTGITLGKHGDQYDNTSANSAEGYVLTIERATAQGWSGENIGHHIIRNNHISHCEQAGIVGSMGAVFSQVTGNEIHDIHFRQLFSGAEQAGIKFHGSIDCLIAGNHIYRSNRGIWLDWMTQGTRITRNFLHDNGPSEDIFLEVNHGPFLVDNNLFLSRSAILVNSQGGAYVHNLIAGGIDVYAGENRLTPHLKAHSTEVAGLAPNKSGDERYYNNILTGTADLGEYDKTVLPVWMDGNVYLNGANPGKAEPYPLQLPDFNPGLKISVQAGVWYLEFAIDKSWSEAQQRKTVTTELLGRVSVPDLPYEQYDGKPYLLDSDYLGAATDTKAPFPGPFALSSYDNQPIRIWPLKD